MVSTQIFTPRVVMPRPKAVTTTAQRVKSVAGKTWIIAARTPSAVTYLPIPKRLAIDGVATAPTAYPAPEAPTATPKPASPAPTSARSRWLRKSRIVATIAHDVAEPLANCGVDPLQVRSEVGKPCCEDRGQEVARGADDEHHAVAVRSGMDGSSKPEAGEVGECAARGRDGVRGDEEGAADDVRQARGEPGEQEPVH